MLRSSLRSWREITGSQTPQWLIRELGSLHFTRSDRVQLIVCLLAEEDEVNSCEPLAPLLRGGGARNMVCLEEGERETWYVSTPSGVKEHGVERPMATCWPSASRVPVAQLKHWNGRRLAATRCTAKWLESSALP